MSDLVWEEWLENKFQDLQVEFLDEGMSCEEAFNLALEKIEELKEEME